MIKRILFLCCSLTFFITSLTAQLSGTISDSETGDPIVGAEVTIPDYQLFAITNASGKFTIVNISPGSYEINVVADNYTSISKTIDAASFSESLNLKITRGSDNTVQADDIATISEFDLLDNDDAQIASLLTASRDPFNNVANFNLRAARFRMRGYENTHNQIFVGGIPFNSLNRGNAYWGTWGGLNDMFRSKDETIGLQPTGYTLGGIAGAINIDNRPSRHRRQLKASYSVANTSYRNRVMLTYGTGVMANGWAVSASAGRRWGQEGYQRGTFYDGYSAFIGVEKQFSPQHSIALTIFNVNTVRGRNSASTQEVYDLAGDNFYNPNWGYLNGEVRNPRQYRNNLTTAILRYDNQFDNRSKITTSLGFQTGKDASTGLDWFQAPDPRPDYYRKLPSFADVPSVEADIAEYYRSNPDLLQLNLDELYVINSQRVETIRSANGIEGNEITGKFAAYKIEEQHYDPTKIMFNNVVNIPLGDNLLINAGLGHVYEGIDNHKVVDNLLGADFAVDWNNFADESGDASLEIDPNIQNNQLEPNRILKVGDKFGYNYIMHHHKSSAWAQAERTFNRLDVFVGGGADRSSFYREGLYQNGQFPDLSLGKGETVSYITGTIKGGLTMKFNGRNYAYATAAYLTRPPLSRNSYITPRTRGSLIEGLVPEKITAGEIGYNARYPKFKARVSAYYTDMQDQFETRNVYFDDLNEFGNLITKDIDTRHIGMELGIDYNLSSTINVTGGLALGEHIYTNNPTTQFALDDNVPIVEFGNTYFKGHYFSGGPQTAATVGVKYSSPKYWSVTLNANYFDRSYISMSATRRTQRVMDLIVGSYLDDLDASDRTDLNDAEYNYLVNELPFVPEVINEVYGQEKYPRAMTVDLFARKTFKVDRYFIALNCSVNNLLDNQFRSGGFEQLRLRYLATIDETGSLNLKNYFPPRYYYAYGRTYFITLSISFDQ